LHNLGGHIQAETRILNRVQKSALYNDPHLRSSPILGEGKRRGAVMQGLQRGRCVGKKTASTQSVEALEIKSKSCIEFFNTLLGNTRLGKYAQKVFRVEAVADLFRAISERRLEAGDRVAAALGVRIVGREQVQVRV
jgi:hypothetical protein